MWFSGSDLGFHLQGRERLDVTGGGSEAGARRERSQGPLTLYGRVATEATRTQGIELALMASDDLFSC